VERVKTEVKVN